MERERISQRRRQKILEAERVKRRSLHGDRLAGLLSICSEKPLILSDFVVEAAIPFSIFCAEDISQSPGLVAAYIDKNQAFEIISCVQIELGFIGGMIGIYGNDYLGYACTEALRLCNAIEAAEALNEGVVIVPNGIFGAFLIDFYSGNSTGCFSVIAQGAEIEMRTRMCFGVN